MCRYKFWLLFLDLSGWNPLYTLVKNKIKTIISSLNCYFLIISSLCVYIPEHINLSYITTAQQIESSLCGV